MFFDVRQRQQITKNVKQLSFEFGHKKRVIDFEQFICIILTQFAKN